MELNFFSPFVKANIKAISAYFEAKAQGKASTLVIDGQVILSCDGTQGIDWNNEEVTFDNFDYEGIVIAFDELQAGLIVLDTITATIEDVTVAEGINTTRTIVVKHPMGKAPRGAGEFDTITRVTLTPSGINKMNTWLMMTNNAYRKANAVEKSLIIDQYLFDPRFRLDGSLAFVRNYAHQETLTCELLRDTDIASVYGITTMVKKDVNYGNTYSVSGGGHTSHRAKSDFAYRGYGA